MQPNSGQRLDRFDQLAGQATREAAPHVFKPCTESTRPLTENDDVSAMASGGEPERTVEQQAQNEAIAQRILSGTWAGQDAVGPFLEAKHSIRLY